MGKGVVDVTCPFDNRHHGVERTMWIASYTGCHYQHESPSLVIVTAMYYSEV